MSVTLNCLSTSGLALNNYKNVRLAGKPTNQELDTHRIRIFRILFFGIICYNVYNKYLFHVVSVQVPGRANKREYKLHR